MIFFKGICTLNCQNDGRCVLNNEFNYKCACFGLYFGELCQYNALIIIILGSFFTFASCLGFILICLCYKRTKYASHFAEK